MDATVIALGVVALLVRVGLAWYATGLARSKNAAGAVLRQVYDLCVAVLAFWAIGAAIMQAASAVVGVEPGLLLDWSGRMGRTTFLYLVMVLIVTGVVPGALGERSRFGPVGIVSAVLAGVLVPLAGQWAWNGWLERAGFLDIAGASVLHVTAGLTAAVGAVAVGPRTGKYNRDGSSNFIPGHCVPLASVGVILILVGWLAYVTVAAYLHRVSFGGPTIEQVLNADAVPQDLLRAPLHALLAAAAGGAAALAFTSVRYGKPDLHLVYSGILGALVAIAAGVSAISSLGAVIIGGGAGILVPWAVGKIDLGWRIDDLTGTIASHVVGGTWGTLAVALFVPLPLAGRLVQLSKQALGLAVIAILALLIAGATFAVLKRTVGLRSKEADEYDGLDLAEHDVNAYPDFQQTMIKSYHLREA